MYGFLQCYRWFNAAYTDYFIIPLPINGSSSSLYLVCSNLLLVETFLPATTDNSEEESSLQEKLLPTATLSVVKEMV